MADLEPITREELLLNSIAGEGDSGVTPITRQEMYLSAIAGESDLPEGMEPITREEIYYQKILDNGGAGGGGGEATGTKTISINSNGTTSHNVKAYATAQIITNVPNPSTGTKEITSNGDHDVTDYATAHVAVPQPSGSTSITSNGTHNVADYEEAVVNVPNSYASSDEGKVVSNGALASQTSRQVTANGTYDTTLNSSVEVAVPASGITPTGSTNITANGTHDVTNYASAVVNVPNSYGSSDEGKVVNNGALVAQTSQTVTENGTYDTTTKNEVVVNVASSGGGVHTEEGYIELTDESVGTLTIPVDLTSAEAFRIQAYVVETGEVADGVVTRYDKAEVPVGFNSSNAALVTNYGCVMPLYKEALVYRDETNLAGNRFSSNIAYAVAWRGNNGTTVTLNVAPSVNSQGVSLVTNNAGRAFCRAGTYIKYKYEITWR